MKNYFGGKGRTYGPHCEYRKRLGAINADDYPSFEEFAKELKEVCHDGEKSFEWTVDEKTPNMVYYAVSLWFYD